MKSGLKDKNQNLRHLTKFFILFITLCFFTTCYAEDSSSPQITTITVSEGLKLATEKNRIIKIASFNKDISSADTLIARSRFFPTIDVSANQTFLSNQPGAYFGQQAVFTSEKSFLSYGLNVNQILYDFGARTSLYEASKTSLETTKLDIVRTKNLVALDFISACLNLLESEKMILVAKSEVERLESHLKVAQSLFNEGVITKNDLLQTEVKLSDSKQRLLTTRNIREFNVSRINNILSRPLKEDIRVVEVPVDTVKDLKLDTAWELAEKQRIELQIIDHELKITGLEENAKNSEYYPKIFAQGGYNYTENRYLLHEDNWSLLFGVNFNLFSGGSTKAEILKIRYRRDQLLEQKNKILDDIKLEVKKNYLDMENAREKIQVTKDAINQAEENLRINRIRYEEGIGTATDVLDAITLLTVAETNYHRAVYELRRAQAGLIYSMGFDLVSSYI